MNIKLFMQKTLLLGVCALSLQAAQAQADGPITCPTVEELTRFEGSLQFTHILGYDAQSNSMLGSLDQIEEGEEGSDTQSFLFTISGFPVAYGQNIDDSAHAVMNTLQLDSNMPATFEVAANRKDKGDHLKEDGPFSFCSYSVPNNPQIKAIAVFFYPKNASVSARA